MLIFQNQLTLIHFYKLWQIAKIKWYYKENNDGVILNKVKRFSFIFLCILFLSCKSSQIEKKEVVEQKKQIETETQKETEKSTTIQKKQNNEITLLFG